MHYKHKNNICEHCSKSPGSEDKNLQNQHHVVRKVVCQCNHIGVYTGQKKEGKCKRGGKADSISAITFFGKRPLHDIDKIHDCRFPPVLNTIQLVIVYRKQHGTILFLVIIIYSRSPQEIGFWLVSAFSAVLLSCRCMWGETANPIQHIICLVAIWNCPTSDEYLVKVMIIR